MSSMLMSGESGNRVAVETARTPGSARSVSIARSSNAFARASIDDSRHEGLAPQPQEQSGAKLTEDPLC